MKQRGKKGKERTEEGEKGKGKRKKIKERKEILVRKKEKGNVRYVLGIFRSDPSAALPAVPHISTTC